MISRMTLLHGVSKVVNYCTQGLYVYLYVNLILFRINIQHKITQPTTKLKSLLLRILI
jgi:hypothetical protein